MSRRSRRRRLRSRSRPAPLPPFLRRRSTRWLLAAIITLAIGAVLGAIGSCMDSGDGANGTPTATRVARTLPAASATVGIAEPTPSPEIVLPEIEPDPARLERAEVLDIIDGDTIDVRIAGREERVRYYGIDTPERGDDCYGDATDRNEALAGETVLLLPDARERDRFGRLLRYVFDEQGRSIDALLIAEGLAHAWREDGAYRDALIGLEGEVSAAGVGCLWGS